MAPPPSIPVAPHADLETPARPPEAAAPPPVASRRVVERREADAAWSARRLALLALTALALYLCWLIARPFFSSLAWASALAVVAWPLHRRIARQLTSPSVAALLSSTAIALLIGVPAAALLPRALAESAAGLASVRDWFVSGGAHAMLGEHAWLRPALRWIEQALDGPALVQRAGDLLADVGTAAARASFDGLLQLALTFFLLFYFLRDRDAVLARIVELLPLSRAESRALLREIGDTLHATLVGKLLVSLLQGLLGGIAFAWVGLPAAGFWAMVMAVVALVPVLGTPVVWGPVALWLGMNGRWFEATAVALWGATVVGLADNLLYPMMVGNRVRLHMVPMLLSMIGGLFVFGMAGFFVGPVVLAATLALLRVWSARSGEPTRRAG